MQEPGPANSRTSSSLSAPVISSSLATTGCGRARTSLPCLPCSARAARTRTRTLAESRNDSPDASTVTSRAPVSSCAASVSRSTVAEPDVPLVEAEARFARLRLDQARRLFSRLASPDAANPDVAHD